MSSLLFAFSCKKSAICIRENVIKKMKNPGKKLTHHAIPMTSLPSLNKLPQLICGALIPSPRKLSPDSARIAPPTPKVNEMR